MLSRLVREHKVKAAKLRDDNEQRRKAAIASVGVVVNALTDSVNKGIVAVFENQRLIEEEARTLQQNAAKFSKQTTQWLTLIDSFNQALKEIGDVENWAKSIEEDMQYISSSLDYVQRTRYPSSLV